MNAHQKKFSVPSDKIYLNGAYMSPMPLSVVEAGQQALLRKQDPTSISQTDFFTDQEKLKKSFARLCNIPDHHNVAIIPSVSYGMATVAKNISGKKGGKIIVASEQFPSNIYPWQDLAQQQKLELITVSPPAQLTNRGKLWNENILEAIDENTVMVAIGHVHWADGTRFDLKRIRKATQEAGALLIIDGTQSVGALPFDVGEINPDALICAGYKWLMGPYSIGLAYYGEYFRNGQPLEHNWINRQNSEDFRGLINYEARYQPGMTRYDMGEKSNFILVPMLLAAVEFLNETGPVNIQDHCGQIAQKALELLKKSDWWVEEPEFRANHLFGLRPPHGVDIADAAKKLLENKIYVSLRGEVIRVSPNIYNDQNDLNRMAEILCA